MLKTALFAAAISLSATAALAQAAPMDMSWAIQSQMRNQMVGDQDPEFATNDALSASVDLIMYAMQMAADRAQNPGEDLVTKLVEADVDGRPVAYHFKRSIEIAGYGDPVRVPADQVIHLFHRKRAGPRER